MGFIAKEPLRFGGDVIMPGEEVPVEVGRNYRGMLQRGEIVLVGEVGTDVSGPRGKISRGRARRKQLDQVEPQLQTEADEPTPELEVEEPVEAPAEPVNE